MSFFGSHMQNVLISDSVVPGSEFERWTPIPPNGKTCPFTGLKHAKLYQLLGPGGLAREQVRVANLRTPGAKRGQTLFHVGDMLRFLDGLATDQAGNRPGEGETINQKGGNNASQ